MPIPLKQPAPKKEPVKMKIYHTLCEWITYGTLQPGENILKSAARPCARPCRCWPDRS